MFARVSVSFLISFLLAAAMSAGAQDLEWPRDLDFSLDDLLTSLEAAEEEIAAAQNLNMEPPLIVYRDHPALLVYIDGDPVWMRKFRKPRQ